MFNKTQVSSTNNQVNFDFDTAKEYLTIKITYNILVTKD